MPTEATAAEAVATEPPEPSPTLRPASRVLTMSAEEEEGRVVIVVRGNGKLAFRHHRLPEPERIVVDFRDVVLPGAFRRPSMMKGPVAGLRVAQYRLKPDVVRLVIDLHTAAPYTVAEEGGGVRIVVGPPPE
jgi:hypothetical protein